MEVGERLITYVKYTDIDKCMLVTFQRIRIFKRL